MAITRARRLDGLNDKVPTVPAASCIGSVVSLGGGDRAWVGTVGETEGLASALLLTCTTFRFRGFEVKISCSGFSVQGLGFRVQGSGFSVQGSEFRVQGLEFRFRGAQYRRSGFGIQEV